MIITLMGFMGSGKTSIGTLVAKIIKVKFIDLDEYIVRKEGRSINDIFIKEGEDYFRKLETKYIKKIIQKKKKTIVLALGGGAACNNDNWDYLTKTETVYLKRSTTYLYNNLKEKKLKRPLIKNLSDDELTLFISKKIKERENYYTRSNLIIGGNATKSNLANLIAFAVFNSEYKLK